MIKKFWRIGSAAAVLILAIAALKMPAKAQTAVINISNNPGGRIGDFISRLHQYRMAHAQVEFDGTCDSACTLLLALPYEQTCINTGAVFRFHAPSAASQRVEFAARTFLLASYPDWVQSWISKNNGLTPQLISMDYAYASQFMRTCNLIASR